MTVNGAVFRRLCQIVGTSTQVTIRRETRDIEETVNEQVADDDDVIQMESGSKREGFRMKGSDVDSMVWLNSHRVIWDMSQCEFPYTATKTLILSNSSVSPPGFSLLELLTPTSDSSVQSACIRMNDRLFISSSLYRNRKQHLLFQDSIQHGPCVSGNVGGVEYDLAYCFVCDFWPPDASSWINRCKFWPNKEVFDDIVRNGCHFVPIGNPLGIHGHEEKEWRISFSLAEQKLVHSMNYCQFLIYGLLKIFLKEVIKKKLDESNKLLCSYHIKTVVFWVIQQNPIPIWCLQNLLSGFWVCFKLLLKCVYEGVCPHFFIPQNNLFLSKIHGSAQRSLFHQLYDLYEKGLTACLLQTHSFSPYITDVQNFPRHAFCSFEYQMILEMNCGLDLFNGIKLNSMLFKKGLNRCTKYLHTVEQLTGSPLTQYQVAKLQTMTAEILQNTAFLLHNMFANTGLNKKMYIANKMSRQMLKLAAKFGCISDMVYIAMYYYKTFRYPEALSVVEIIKDKIAQTSMYLTHWGYINPNGYQGGQGCCTKIREAVPIDIRLQTSICYINELTPERQIALQNNRDTMHIPLFVLLHFVEFLSYRHIDTTLAQAALDKLQDLVHHNQDINVDKLAGDISWQNEEFFWPRHIDTSSAPAALDKPQDLVHHDQGPNECEVFKDISWQILGICQQITGNHKDALYSYQQSLQQYPVNLIQTATLIRIKNIQVFESAN